MKLIIPLSERINPNSVSFALVTTRKSLSFRVLISYPVHAQVSLNISYNINCFGSVFLLRFSVNVEELCPLLPSDSRSSTPLPETRTFVRTHESQRGLLGWLWGVELLSLFSFVRCYDAFSRVLLMAKGNWLTEQSHCYNWIFKKTRALVRALLVLTLRNCGCWPSA